MKFPFFKKRESTPLSVRLIGETDIGLKRSQNQDAYIAVIGDHSGQGYDALAIVADGMGGHVRGDVASHMAIEVITSQLKELFEIATEFGGITKEYSSEECDEMKKQVKTLLEDEVIEGIHGLKTRLRHDKFK